MMKFSHSAAAMAALFALGITTAPVLAQAPGAGGMTDEQCVAEFGKADANRDERLGDGEMTPYTTVKSQVDVNNDGEISSEEYVVACKEGIFEEIYKNQG